MPNLWLIIPLAAIASIAARADGEAQTVVA